MMATIASEEVKQNLPGWSLARDTPRPPKKQGWQCPAPTVEDWEDYKKWKEEQGRKEELPTAPQFFLADSDLLFYQDKDVQLPWIHRIRCELPRRVGRLSGELPVKASYIGFGTDNNDDFYEVFKRAMLQIGITLCRQIHNPPNRFELAHLEQSDLILVGGGDRKRLWEALGTDLGGSAVAEHVKWRYYQGAVVVALGEAMSLLGEKSWYMHSDKQTVIPFTGWKIFPHVIAPESENVDLEDMVKDLGGAGVVILGVHPGGGMIFNKDGLVEPVRQMVQEYRWDWQSESVKQALLLGPPRSTGLICPLYAAMKKREGEAGDDEASADVFAYALTSEEEDEETNLIEHFDIHNSWLTPQSRSEVENLKKAGNDAFRAGKASLANINYEHARVLLRSSAKRWNELDNETQDMLNTLAKPKKPNAQLLPSERRKLQEEQSFGQKEDFRATTLLIPLLLNICACHLLAYDQDKSRKEKDADGCAAAAPVASTESSEGGEHPTTLVEVRDNLVEAFRAANDALLLSGGQLAKAWFRRGTVFEKLRDPRNAERDFEESLLRSPGDKTITKKRDDAKEAACKVAENMYYARHKELDSEEQKLNADVRHALYLRGSYTDTYKDERNQFAVAQPLARLVDGTLEEVDGRFRLVPSATCSELEAAYMHPHALWTWEFLIQRAPSLRLFQVEDVDLGSGPLEWICKGLRAHSEIRSLRLVGVHLGSAGAKMMRNVLAQSRSLLEVALDRCGLLDSGLGEVADGLRDNSGTLEVISLQHNHITARRLGKLADALCDQSTSIGLTDLDLSENPLSASGSKEVARIIGSSVHKLRVIRLQDCLLDLACFWRLVGNLDDARPLSQLDLRLNPIGRGTRRCWHAQMGPTIRCEVLLTDHPLKARKVAQEASKRDPVRDYPLPRMWM